MTHLLRYVTSLKQMLPWNGRKFLQKISKRQCAENSYKLSDGAEKVVVLILRALKRN